MPIAAPNATSPDYFLATLRRWLCMLSLLRDYADFQLMPPITDADCRHFFRCRRLPPFHYAAGHYAASFVDYISFHAADGFLYWLRLLMLEARLYYAITLSLYYAAVPLILMPLIILIEFISMFIIVADDIIDADYWLRIIYARWWWYATCH